MIDVAEFIGGPMDGDVVAIRGERDGLPSPWIRIACAPDVAANFYQETEPTELTITYLVYVRDSISDETHRWRYRLS